MFKVEMKTLIKFAMEKNISAIETKSGYNGAPILRISSMSLEELSLIKEWCDKLGYDNVIYSNGSADTPIALQTAPLEYSLFCVFGEDTIDNDIYQLQAN